MNGILNEEKFNMSKPSLVSVVITTYGRSELLGRAIESVLVQTYDNIEIIVVDDNDSNSEHRMHTENILQNYIQSYGINYLKHESNSGASAARNTGIKASKGEYVAFLDDDDEWFPEKIEKQISYFESLDSKVGVIYCSYILEEHNGDKEWSRSEKGDLTKELLMLEFEPGASSTLIFKKAVLDEIGEFDESLERNEEIELLVRLCRSYLIDVCPDILLKVNGHHFPTASRIESVKKNFFRVLKRDIERFSFFEQREIYAQHYMELSSLFFSERDVTNTIKYYLKAVGYYFPLLFNNKVNKRLIVFVAKKTGLVITK